MNQSSDRSRANAQNKSQFDYTSHNVDDNPEEALREELRQERLRHQETLSKLKDAEAKLEFEELAAKNKNSMWCCESEGSSDSGAQTRSVSPASESTRARANAFAVEAKEGGSRSFSGLSRESEDPRIAKLEAELHSKNCQMEKMEQEHKETLRQLSLSSKSESEHFLSLRIAELQSRIYKMEQEHKETIGALSIKSKSKSEALDLKESRNRALEIRNKELYNNFQAELVKSKAKDQRIKELEEKMEQEHRKLSLESKPKSEALDHKESQIRALEEENKKLRRRFQAKLEESQAKAQRIQELEDRYSKKTSELRKHEKQLLELLSDDSSNVGLSLRLRNSQAENENLRNELKKATEERERNFRKATMLEERLRIKEQAHWKELREIKRRYRI